MTRREVATGMVLVGLALTLAGVSRWLLRGATTRPLVSLVERPTGSRSPQPPPIAVATGTAEARRRDRPTATSVESVSHARDEEGGLVIRGSLATADGRPLGDRRFLARLIAVPSTAVPEAEFELSPLAQTGHFKITWRATDGRVVNTEAIVDTPPLTRVVDLPYFLDGDEARPPEEPEPALRLDDPTQFVTDAGGAFAIRAERTAGRLWPELSLVEDVPRSREGHRARGLRVVIPTADETRPVADLGRVALPAPWLLLTGTVVDRVGDPVPDARIECRSKLVATSNSSGFFAIYGPFAIDPTPVRVTRDGYVPLRVRSIAGLEIRFVLRRSE